MNFQQLRSVREAIRCGFNLTEVAKVLHTSQPGVSRQIRELEEELGVDLFVRAGKRLTSLTEVGALIVPIVENMLSDADNLKRAGEEFSQHATGRLSDGAPLTLARLAGFPIITYGPGYTGRTHIDEAFEKAGIQIDLCSPRWMRTWSRPMSNSAWASASSRRSRSTSSATATCARWTRATCSRST
jgi:DNA-binding transcriptional LysR family regulator